MVTMFETDKEPDFKANTIMCDDPRTQNLLQQFRGEGTAPLMFVQLTFSLVLYDNRIPHISADLAAPGPNTALG